MNRLDDRLHDALDGDLPPEALTIEEREQLQQLSARFNEITSAVRSVPVPDLTERVMAALPDVEGAAAPEPARPGLLARLVRWLWAPVSVPVRPAFALGGVVLALLAIPVRQAISPTTSSSPQLAADEDEPRLYVQFRLEVPGATRVAVAGSFTGWQPEYELQEVSPGVWSALVPLRPGVHDYTFVIDGTRMVTDPYAPRVADSFGGSNSRLFLPAPDGRA